MVERRHLNKADARVFEHFEKAPSRRLGESQSFAAGNVDVKRGVSTGAQTVEQNAVSMGAHQQSAGSENAVIRETGQGCVRFGIYKVKYFASEQPQRDEGLTQVVGALPPGSGIVVDIISVIGQMRVDAK